MQIFSVFKFIIFTCGHAKPHGLSVGRSGRRNSRIQVEMLRRGDKKINRRYRHSIHHNCDFDCDFYLCLLISKVIGKSLFGIARNLLMEFVFSLILSLSRTHTCCFSHFFVIFVHQMTEKNLSHSMFANGNVSLPADWSTSTLIIQRSIFGTLSSLSSFYCQRQLEFAISFSPRCS